LSRTSSIRLRIRISLGIALAVAGLASWSDAPAASVDLAGCAGLMRAMADIAQAEDEARMFATLASDWTLAGVEQARREGHFYPEFFIEAATLSAADEWRRQSARPAAADRLDEELGHCDRLAERSEVFRIAGAPG